MQTATALALLFTLIAPACDAGRATDYGRTEALIDARVSGSAVVTFPDVIHLPDGFWPEGIAFGRGTTFFTGSLATGAIWRGDARTGDGSYLVNPQPGREIVGMKYDAATDRLIVAGGGTGQAFVIDATSGANIATLQPGNPSQGTLVNDVALMGDFAYFTDSFQPVIYKVKLSSPTTVETLPLTGEFHYDSTATLGNLNGIVALPGGKELIAVNMADGGLYLIDARTGNTTRIDLGGASVPGDGLLLIGNTIYVVEGYINQITPIRMNNEFRSGTVKQGLTSPNLQFPSTIAALGNYLYAVNARFDTSYDPTLKYTVARIAR